MYSQTFPKICVFVNCNEMYLNIYKKLEKLNIDKINLLLLATLGWTDRQHGGKTSPMPKRAKNGPKSGYIFIRKPASQPPNLNQTYTLATTELIFFNFQT